MKRFDLRGLIAVAILCIATVLITTALAAQSSSQNSELAVAAIRQPDAPTAVMQAAPIPAPTFAPVEQHSDKVVRFFSGPVLATSPEIVSPFRGFYRWLDQELVPAPDPLPQFSYDAYDRFEWRDLEPKKDQYDFSVIEKAAQQAKAEGRKFSFRVRTVVSTEGEKVPEYLSNAMDKGWWYDYNDNGKDDTYVPDWNDSYFLERAQRLLAALGERYDRDPRIGWIDVGIYGNWGEWHMHSFPYPSPSGAQSITAANKRRIVDMHVAAFPSKQILMLSDDTPTLLYALKQSPRMGWRRDSLGDEHFDKVSRNDEAWKMIENRWKTAPVVTEFINASRQSTPESYERARDQVKRYHVSLVGNGNTIRWDRLDKQERDALVAVGKAAGYRYILQEASLPETLRIGTLFTLESRWSNVGVAPTYEPWNVVWQLRAVESNAIGWEGVSSVDLRTLLPNEHDQAAQKDVQYAARTLQPDTFRLPSTMPTGNYNLHLIIRDPSRYRAPLPLAIEGRQDDGSYMLGTVYVQP